MRHDTLHTVSLVEGCLREDDAVLDIGCGAAWVLWQLADRHRLARVAAVDIVDLRRARVHEFALFDGIHIPHERGTFDLVMLNFVLHHVPDEKKLLLLNEARRVCRRNILVLEDTPVNFLDRWASNRHGESFRKRIGSRQPFGFYSKPKWEQLFAANGFPVAASRRISRLARNWRQPYARSVFVLGPF
ncbi:MAG: class I SAM-dependent methyltransferase [Deltaproteobacteria bacterium]|nr:class I SAM-dependent methyltransferase [Deltaproteobacteria bacterium]